MLAIASVWSPTTMALSTAIASRHFATTTACVDCLGPVGLSPRIPKQYGITAITLPASPPDCVALAAFSSS